jgi:hypothetical protein
MFSGLATTTSGDRWRDALTRKQSLESALQRSFRHINNSGAAWA